MANGGTAGDQVDTATASKVSIGQAFSDRRNSLNFLRLVLAATVLLGHAQVLLSYRSDYIVGKTTLGTLAVFGFFGISGYLIATSATRNSVGRFVWQRALRIFPAFWVCLLVTAFGFALIGWFHGRHGCGLRCYFAEGDGPVGFIAHNFWLRIDQEGIRGTLNGVRYPAQWNGSLWSLFYEFLCYLLLAALALVGLLRRRWTVAVLAVSVWVAEIVITSVPRLNAQFNVFRNWDASLMLTLVPVFLAGSLLYLYRDVVPDSGALAWLCVAMLLVSLAVPLGNSYPHLTLTSTDLFAPFIVYPLFWLGIHLPFERIGARNDYSYGVYIYGWPVSQLLALWGVAKWGYAAYASLIALVTVPFAVASWWFVERHALRLKKLAFGVHRPRDSVMPSAPALSPLPLDE